MVLTNPPLIDWSHCLKMVLRLRSMIIWRCSKDWRTLWSTWSAGQWSRLLCLRAWRSAAFFQVQLGRVRRVGAAHVEMTIARRYQEGNVSWSIYLRHQWFVVKQSRSPGDAGVSHDWSDDCAIDPGYLMFCQGWAPVGHRSFHMSQKKNFGAFLAVLWTWSYQFRRLSRLVLGIWPSYKILDLSHEVWFWAEFWFYISC